MTQDELADKSRRDQSTRSLEAWRTTEVEPLRTIRKLAKALDVDPTELLQE